MCFTLLIHLSLQFLIPQFSCFTPFFKLQFSQMNACFQDLPEEIYYSLCDYLSIPDIVTLTKTNTKLRDFFTPFSYRKIIVYQPKKTTRSTIKDSFHPRHRPITANVFFNSSKFSWFKRQLVHEIYTSQLPLSHIHKLTWAETRKFRELYYPNCHTIHLYIIKPSLRQANVFPDFFFLDSFPNIDIKINDLRLNGCLSYLVPKLQTLECYPPNDQNSEIDSLYLDSMIGCSFDKLERLAIKRVSPDAWDSISRLIVSAPQLRELSLAVDVSNIHQLEILSLLPSRISKIFLDITCDASWDLGFADFNEEELPFEDRMRRSQAMNFTRFDATNVTNLTICSGGFSSNHFIQLISAIKFGSLSSIGVDGPNTLALVNAVFGSPSRNYSPTTNAEDPALSSVDTTDLQTVKLRPNGGARLRNRLRIFDKGNILKHITKLDVDLGYSMGLNKQASKRVQIVHLRVLQPILEVLLDDDMALLKKYIGPRAEKTREQRVSEPDELRLVEASIDNRDTHTTDENNVESSDSSTNDNSHNITTQTENEEESLTDELIKILGTKAPILRSFHIPLEQIVKLFYGHNLRIPSPSVDQSREFDSASYQGILNTVSFLDDFFGVTNSLQHLKTLRVARAVGLVHLPQYQYLIHLHPNIENVFWTDPCECFYNLYNDRLVNKMYLQNVTLGGPSQCRHNNHHYYLDVDAMRGKYCEQLCKNPDLHYYEKKQKNDLYFYNPFYKKSIFASGSGWDSVWN